MILKKMMMIMTLMMMMMMIGSRIVAFPVKIVRIPVVPNDVGPAREGCKRSMPRAWGNVLHLHLPNSITQK